MDDQFEDFSERQREILSRVRAEGHGTIEAFSRRFGVSPQTVRRDVNILCEAGVLRRVHGGVEPPSSGNLLYSSRRVLNGAAKLFIARAFATHVESGQSLAVSIGTTPEFAVQALSGLSDLTILTNNLNIAVSACDRDSWTLQVPGGLVRAGDRDILGPETEAFFDRYQVDIGVFGVAGVAEDGTLLDFTESEVASRMAILRNCRRSFLLLDRTKFGRAVHVRGGHISDVSHVISDAPLPGKIAGLLAGSDTRVTIASGDRA